MNNPICNTVFDSRDLIEYKEYLEEALLELWKEYFNGTDEQEDGNTDDHTFEDVDLSLEGFRDAYGDEIEEYEAIVEFIEELDGYSRDFKWGEAIIHSSYFSDYIQEFCEDCGYIPKDIPCWIEIDWEATAENLKADYSCVSYDGEDYYIRCS